MSKLPPPPDSLLDRISAARVNRAAEEKTGEIRGLGVNASRLGHQCYRALWHDLRWASPEPEHSARTLRIFERGKMEEARVISDLRQAGCRVEEVDPETGQQWRFSLAEGWIRGYADGMVIGVPEAPKAWHVLEIKTAKAADWRAIQKHGLEAAKPEHWHQLHIGMAGLNRGRGLYICVNKDTEELLMERIRLDRQIARHQIMRVLDLLEDSDGPLRLEVPADKFPCGWCEHRAVCKEDATPRRTCRSCVWFEFGKDGNGTCHVSSGGLPADYVPEERNPTAQLLACEMWERKS